MIACFLSEYIIGIVLPSNTEELIIKAFRDDSLYAYGVPSHCLYTYTRNICRKTVMKLCEIFKIKAKRVPPSYVQVKRLQQRNANAIICILQDVLECCEVPACKWKSILPELMFALNCSKHQGSEYSPYEMVYGRSPNPPLNAKYGTVFEIICKKLNSKQQ